MNRRANASVLLTHSQVLVGQPAVLWITCGYPVGIAKSYSQKTMKSCNSAIAAVSGPSSSSTLHAEASIRRLLDLASDGRLDTAGGGESVSRRQRPERRNRPPARGLGNRQGFGPFVLRGRRSRRPGIGRTGRGPDSPASRGGALPRVPPWRRDRRPRRFSAVRGARPAPERGARVGRQRPASTVFPGIVPLAPHSFGGTSAGARLGLDRMYQTP